jgi:Spy/CpxP family protein refolding chaperone
MKRFAAVVFSAVLVLVFSALLFAEGKGPGPGGRMGGGMEGGFMMSPKMILGMASELNLTADQMEKIKKIADETPEKAGNKDEMKNESDAIKEEMDKDSPDEAKIVGIMTKINDKHLTAMKAGIHTALEVRAVLTKDQREILKKKMEEKKEKLSKGDWKNKK